MIKEQINELLIGSIGFENVYLQFLLNLNNNTSCHVILVNFQKRRQGGECSLIYQCSITIECQTVCK